MSPNSLFSSFLNPVQFVPAGSVLDPRYHVKDMNLYWFNEQIASWVNQNDYSQPWMTADNTIPLQFITRDLTNVSVLVYSCAGILLSTIVFTEISTPGVIPPYHWWRGTVPIGALPVGGYYYTVVAGTGGNTVTWISERQNIQTDHPTTILQEFTDIENKQGFIFADKQVYPYRISAQFDNMINLKSLDSFYVDQLQDIEMINAINYETRDLFLGSGTEGVPDWAARKFYRIMNLKSVLLDGIGYSRAKGSTLERVRVDGAPKKFWKLEIQPASALDGISSTVAGVDNDASMMISLDSQYFGPNSGNSGGTAPNIVETEIS